MTSKEYSRIHPLPAKPQAASGWEVSQYFILRLIQGASGNYVVYLLLFLGLFGGRPITSALVMVIMYAVFNLSTYMLRSVNVYR